MTHQPAGNVQPLAAWFVVLLAALPTAPAGGDDLNVAMGKLAELIEQRLDAEGESTVALNQFTAPARLAANASSGIRNALEKELKRREIQVKNSARFGINGEYRVVDDPVEQKTVVRIVGRMVDQNNGRILSQYNMDVEKSHVDRRPGRRHDGGPARPRVRGSRAGDPRRPPETERTSRFDPDLGRSQEPLRA